MGFVGNHELPRSARSGLTWKVHKQNYEREPRSLQLRLGVANKNFADNSIDQSTSAKESPKYICLMSYLTYVCGGMLAQTKQHGTVTLGKSNSDMYTTGPMTTSSSKTLTSCNCTCLMMQLLNGLPCTMTMTADNFSMTCKTLLLTLHRSKASSLLCFKAMHLEPFCKKFHHLDPGYFCPSLRF